MSNPSGSPTAAEILETSNQVLDLLGRCASLVAVADLCCPRLAVPQFAPGLIEFDAALQATEAAVARSQVPFRRASLRAGSPPPIGNLGSAHEAAVGFARYQVKGTADQAAWRARYRAPRQPGASVTGPVGADEYKRFATQIAAALIAENPRPHPELDRAVKQEAAEAVGLIGQPGPARAARRRTCRVRVKGRTVTLDGEVLQLGGTAEANAAGRCFLGHLIAAGGVWVSGSDINRSEQHRRSGHDGQRWDRVRKRLPDNLSGLVESNRRTGYRLSPEAWR